MQKRTIRIPVLVTADEKEILKKEADRIGLPISAYIRLKALDAVRPKD